MSETPFPSYTMFDLLTSSVEKMLSYIVGHLGGFYLNIKNILKICFVAIVACIYVINPPVARDVFFDHSIASILPFFVESPQIYKTGVVNSKGFSVESTGSFELTGAVFNLSVPTWNSFESFVAMVNDDARVRVVTKQSVDLRDPCVYGDNVCYCERSVGSGFPGFCANPVKGELRSGYTARYRGISVNREVTCSFTRRVDSKYIKNLDFLMYTALGFDQPEFSPFVVALKPADFVCKFLSVDYLSNEIFVELASVGAVPLTDLMWRQFFTHYMWGILPRKGLRDLMWNIRNPAEGRNFHELVMTAKRRVPEYYDSLLLWIENTFTVENMRVMLEELVRFLDERRLQLISECERIAAIGRSEFERLQIEAGTMVSEVTEDLTVRLKPVQRDLWMLYDRIVSEVRNFFSRIDLLAFVDSFKSLFTNIDLYFSNFNLYVQDKINGFMSHASESVVTMVETVTVTSVDVSTLTLPTVTMTSVLTTTEITSSSLTVTPTPDETLLYHNEEKSLISRTLDLVLTIEYYIVFVWQLIFGIMALATVILCLAVGLFWEQKGNGGSFVWDKWSTRDDSGDDSGLVEGVTCDRPESIAAPTLEEHHVEDSASHDMDASMCRSVDSDCRDTLLQIKKHVDSLKIDTSVGNGTHLGTSALDSFDNPVAKASALLSRMPDRIWKKQTVRRSSEIVTPAPSLNNTGHIRLSKSVSNFAPPQTPSSLKKHDMEMAFKFGTVLENWPDSVRLVPSKLTVSGTIDRCPVKADGAFREGPCYVDLVNISRDQIDNLDLPRTKPISEVLEMVKAIPDELYATRRWIFDIYYDEQLHSVLHVTNGHEFMVRDANWCFPLLTKRAVVDLLEALHTAQSDLRVGAKPPSAEEIDEMLRRDKAKPTQSWLDSLPQEVAWADDNDDPVISHPETEDESGSGSMQSSVGLTDSLDLAGEALVENARSGKHSRLNDRISVTNSDSSRAVSSKAEKLSVTHTVKSIDDSEVVVHPSKSKGRSDKKSANLSKGKETVSSNRMRGVPIPKNIHKIKCREVEAYRIVTSKDVMFVPEGVTRDLTALTRTLNSETVKRIGFVNELFSDGFCYLRLLEKKDAAAARSELGFCPTLVDFLGYVDEHRLKMKSLTFVTQGNFVHVFEDAKAVKGCDRLLRELGRSNMYFIGASFSMDSDHVDLDVLRVFKRNVLWSLAFRILSVFLTLIVGVLSSTVVSSAVSVICGLICNLIYGEYYVDVDDYGHFVVGSEAIYYTVVSFLVYVAFFFGVWRLVFLFVLYVVVPVFNFARSVFEMYPFPAKVGQQLRFEHPDSWMLRDVVQFKGVTVNRLLCNMKLMTGGTTNTTNHYAAASSSLTAKEIPYNVSTKRGLMKRIRSLLAFVNLRDVTVSQPPVTGRYVPPKTVIPDLLTSSQLSILEKGIGMSIVGSKAAVQTAHKGNYMIYTNAINYIYSSIPEGSIVVDVGSNLAFTPVQGYIAVFSKVAAKDGFRSDSAQKLIRRRRVNGMMPSIDNRDFLSLDIRCTTVVFNFVHDIPFASMMLKCRELGAKSVYVTMTVTGGMLVFGHAQLNVGQQRYSVRDDLISSHFDETNEPYLHDKGNYFSPVLINCVKLPGGEYYYRSVARQFASVVVFHYSLSDVLLDDNNELVVDSFDDGKFRYVAVDISLSLKLSLSGRLIKINEDLVTAIFQADSHTKDGLDFESRVDRVARQISMGIIYGGYKSADTFDELSQKSEEIFQIVAILLGQKYNVPFVRHVSRYGGSLSKRFLHLLLMHLPLLSNENAYKLFMVEPRKISVLSETMNLSGIKFVQPQPDMLKAHTDAWYGAKVTINRNHSIVQRFVSLMRLIFICILKALVIVSWIALMGQLFGFKFVRKVFLDPRTLMVFLFLFVLRISGSVADFIDFVIDNVRSTLGNSDSKLFLWSLGLFNTISSLVYWIVVFPPALTIEMIDMISASNKKVFNVNSIGKLENLPSGDDDEILTSSDIEYCSQRSIAADDSDRIFRASNRSGFAPVTEVNIAKIPQIASGAFMLGSSSIDTNQLLLEKSMLSVRVVRRHGLKLLGNVPTNLFDACFLGSDVVNRLLKDKPTYIDVVMQSLESQHDLIVVCGDLYYCNGDIDAVSSDTVVLIEDGSQLYRRVDLSDGTAQLTKLLKTKRHVNCGSLSRFLSLLASGLKDCGDGQCWRKCLGKEPYDIDSTASKGVIRAHFNRFLIHDIIKYNAVLITEGEVYNLSPSGNKFGLYADANYHCFRINTNFSETYNIKMHELKSASEILFSLDGPLFGGEVSSYHTRICDHYDHLIHKLDPSAKFMEHIIEYVRYLREMEVQTISSFCVFNTEFGLEEALADKKIHVYDNVRRKFIGRTTSKGFSIGWDGQTYVRMNEYTRRFDTLRDYVICHENVLYLREREIVNVLYTLDTNPNKFNFNEVKFISVVGVPGCGKTHEIKTRVAKYGSAGKKVLVLTATKANALEYDPDQTSMFRRFRTYDSYFMLNDSLTADVLFCDESFMVHFAEILLAIMKSKCRKVFMMGDPAQIPFVSRVVSFDLKYQSYVSPNVEYRDVTYRVPEAHLDMLRVFYPNISSRNNYSASAPTIEYCKTGEPKITGYDVIICFTQNEKAILAEVNPGENVNTIHEVQGNTYDNVVIVRLVKHENQIYDSEPHLRVAISRQRKKLHYLTVNDSDLLSKLFKNPKKFRRDHKEFVESSLVGPCHYVSWEYADEVMEDVELDVQKFEKPILDVVNSKYSYSMNLHSRQYAEFDLIPKRDYEVDIDDVQKFLDAFYERTDKDRRTYLLEQALLQIPTSIRINMVKFSAAADRPYRELTMLPVLATPQPPLSRGELGTLMEALKTRNINPPLLYLARGQELIGEIVDKFFDVFIDKHKFRAQQFTRSYENGAWLKDWLRGRTADQITLINQVDPSFVRGDVYDSIIKPVAKAKFDNTHNYKLAAPQVVTAHNPYITFLFSGIAKCFSYELKRCMHDHWIINDGLNAENLSGRFNNFMLSAREVRFLEVDFSKYDKSQELLCLKVFIEILRRFDVPEKYLIDWERFHISNLIKFKREGVKARVEYQRRSGDVFTFIGNTLVAMCCIAWSYGDVIRKAHGGVFGGDDSLVVFPASVTLRDNTQVISDVFNLVAKIEHFPTAPVFSSRFLVNCRGRWLFVPDALKAVVKLGRDDLFNFEHVEYYYISFKDNFKCYADSGIVEIVSQMLNHRYKEIFGEKDCSVLCKFLNCLLSDKDLFFRLFVPSEHVSETMPSNKLRSILKSLKLL